jgi:thioredoxin 1
MAIEVNADTFEDVVVASDVPVLVDIWGPRCVPCLAFMPQLADLEKRYGERIKITKVDASQNRRLCLNLKVMGLPTFLVYVDGKEVDRLTGDDLKINDIDEAIKKVAE